MNTYIKKLKHILPIFLLIYVLNLILFLGARWLFTIRYEILDINEEIWDFVLPITLPWIPILIWLRPRMRILRFKNEDSNGSFYLQLISALIITVSLMITQSYLTTAMGKLEVISNIQQIESVSKARYYKLINFSVDPSFAGVSANVTVTGKYNENLNLELFIGIPFLPEAKSFNEKEYKYWYGVKFKKQISNKLNDEEKEKLYTDFYEESMAIMEQYDYHSLDHFERTPTFDDKKYFLQAIESSIKRKPDESYIILEPIPEKFESKNEGKLPWFFGTFGIGFLILLISLIFPSYKVEGSEMLSQDEQVKEYSLRDVLECLFPRGDHMITSILLNLNILIFLIMIFSGVHFFYPDGPSLLEWGANRRIETLAGQWWRLLTNVFVHASFPHLFFNGFGLIISAIFVEPILGRIRFLILYIFSGLCGSLASIVWYPNTISVGASGAIFGLYGAILGLVLMDAFLRDDKKNVLIMIVTFILTGLLWGLFGGIDNASHIGGLVGGTILGIILFQFGKKD
ncbi:rhomboid family intramembrane serine protease [Leptospira kirschneri]|uniref:Peptidase, S54 family n=1 Tax=Leptospira kirschneri str. H1 TaxID=1049966 RepID=A0A0E2B2P4_9LEPT|nr:rhomboid family intramembrane serine protease [Leptospira kirschneri]EKO15536.1 peptidase, S54 family [Leptospira kirschneri str. H1]UML81852.1 rhomboid family intramembrane serine protease [Leptospira kirschneri]